MPRRTILCGLAFLLAAPAFGQTPLGTAFTYQGRLTDAGAPASGIYDLQFALFTAAAVGAQVGSVVTKDDVIVTDGLFTVTLDFGVSAFTGSARWLEIAVQPGAGGGFTTLSPRQELTPTPNALFSRAAGTATTVTGVVGVASGGTGANLTATGGPGQYVKQTNPGAALSVGAIPASDLTGLVGVAGGGTGANLGVTGGPGQYVKQANPGAALSVGAIPASDIPTHVHSTADVVSGTLPVVRGGTGQTAYAVNGAVYASGAGNLAATPAGATGQVLVATSGAAPAWSTTTGITALGTLGSLNVSGTATVGGLSCPGCVGTPALNPTVLSTEGSALNYVFDTTPVDNARVCALGPYAASTNQRALIDGGMAWTLLNSSSGSAAVVFSTNGGSTWTNAFAVSFFDTNLTNAWGNSSRSTSLNLNAGATYLFAVTGWGTFTFTANDTRCFLRVVVVAR